MKTMRIMGVMGLMVLAGMALVGCSSTSAWKQTPPKQYPPSACPMCGTYGLDAAAIELKYLNEAHTSKRVVSSWECPSPWCGVVIQVTNFYSLANGVTWKQAPAGRR